MILSIRYIENDKLNSRILIHVNDSKFDPLLENELISVIHSHIPT